MNQKQHSRSENSAGWQQVQSQPFEASQQAELQRPVNRSYKDTLFRMLFQEKEALLSLYNAVGQTDYKDASQLEIVTLENAIYMNMKNDLAFLINLELNLYEHQSTWNPNMPLRDLFYVAKEYEQLIRKETLYFLPAGEAAGSQIPCFLQRQDAGSGGKDRFKAVGFL